MSGPLKFLASQRSRTVTAASAAGLLVLLALAGSLLVGEHTMGLAQVLLTPTSTAPSASPTNTQVLPGATIRLDPGEFKVTGAFGTPFKVTVVLKGAANLGAFEFAIHFDNDFIKLAGIREDSFLGSSHRVVECHQLSAGSDAVRYGCNTLGPEPPGPTGSGVIASLDFFVQGFAFGETKLLLTNCQVADVLGKQLSLESCEDSDLTINPPQTQPHLEKLPALRNLFLTLGGIRNPPSTCLSGDNRSLIEEVLSDPLPPAPDPKDPSNVQQLGAFQLEVRYDSKLLCVRLLAGPAAAGMVCSVQDSLTAPTLKGIARIACMTAGKTVFPDTTTDAGRHLADLVVRPQPEVYSQLRPNQENGIVTQLLDQDCQLADLQGHLIPITSCDDADVTFRYLEGDVVPDCHVNVIDAQNVAFRWGAQKGSALYSSFFDLAPSGRINGDGRIDATDLQFVFGRLGSTCQRPWPLQPPVNSKLDQPATPEAAETPTPTGTPRPSVNKSPNMLNLLLSSPPASQRCGDSPDAVTFAVVIKDQILSANPKDSSQLQQLGAFQFEMHFDPSRVCIDIAPGLIPDSGMDCLTLSSEGFIRFGCVTKGTGPPPMQPPGPLAFVTVRPQPGVYELLPAGQGQNIVTRISNRNCQLSDLLGHSIPSIGCSGATIDISYP